MYNLLTLIRHCHRNILIGRRPMKIHLNGKTEIITPPRYIGVFVAEQRRDDGVFLLLFYYLRLISFS